MAFYAENLQNDHFHLSKTVRVREWKSVPLPGAPSFRFFSREKSRKGWIPQTFKPALCR
jgi:hypothetical protein